MLSAAACPPCSTKHTHTVFHGESSPCLDLVHPGCAWSSSPACTWHCSLHYLFTPPHPHLTRRSLAHKTGRHTTPNGISIESAVFSPKYTVVTNGRTDGQNGYGTRPVRTGRLRYIAYSRCNSPCVASLAGHTNQRGLELSGPMHEEAHLCHS